MRVLPGLEVQLDHLRRMTGGHGVWQHAVGSTPAPIHGFCTDDNARALIALLRSSDVLGDRDQIRAEAIRYLHHVVGAFNHSTGRFRNFMSSDGCWLEDVGSGDCHGRAIWALGEAGRHALDREVVEDTLSRALPSLLEIDHPRSISYAALGLHACNDIDTMSGCPPGLHHAYESIAARLRWLVDRARDPEWPWVEDRLTYANAVVAEALIVTGTDHHDPKLLDFGLHALEWLVVLQLDAVGQFCPIGSETWYVRGGARSRYSQQPIEAATTSDACLAAFQQTGQVRWLEWARRCLGWFAGANDHGIEMIDPATHGCYDGLHQLGVNPNQGAESTIVWIIAALNYIRAAGVRSPLEAADGREASKTKGDGYPDE